MPPLRLRRAPSGWKIDEAPLIAARGCGGWWIAPDIREILAGHQHYLRILSWLERHELRRARFRCRGEALRAAAAALSVEPLRGAGAVRMVRVGPGEYRSEDRRWTVRRAGRRWEIHDSRRDRRAVVMGAIVGEFWTVHDAARMIAITASL